MTLLEKVTWAIREADSHSCDMGEVIPYEDMAQAAVTAVILYLSYNVTKATNL